MNDIPSIDFHSELDDFELDNETQIANWLLSIAEKENVTLSQLDYVFMNDEALLRVNRTYLDHDYYTDIITFPLHEEGQPIEADIYISIDRVKENALNYDSPFDLELLRVMAHGLLHLCGYADQEAGDQKQMRVKEEESLDLFAEIKRST